jgi:hypothetical protein
LHSFRSKISWRDNLMPFQWARNDCRKNHPSGTDTAFGSCLPLDEKLLESLWLTSLKHQIWLTAKW